VPPEPAPYTRRVPRVVIRPYEERDLDATLDLRLRLYPRWSEAAAEPEWHVRLYGWLARNPAGPLQRWVIDDDGAVVGHLAAVPIRYRIGGKPVVAHTPTDYQALPGYGFHAVRLMRQFFAACENYLACNVIGEVSDIERSFGASAVTDLTHGLKLLDVARWPRRPRRLPAAVMKMAGGALRGLDTALLGAAGRSLTVEEVTDFGAEFDDFFERAAAAVPCLPEKDSTFLSWRYGPGTPRPPTAILGVRDDGQLAGYAVLRTTVRDDGFVLDLMTLPGRRDVGRALLAAAAQRFRRERTFALRYRYVPSALSVSPRDLVRLGFIVRSNTRRALGRVAPERYLELLVRLADPEAQALAVRSDGWAYNLGDGEASFWVH
jgi:hypothetical protein